MKIQQTLIIMTKLLSPLAILLFLFGCNGGGSENTVDVVDTVEIPINEAPLVKYSTAEFSHAYKQALANTVVNGNYYGQIVTQADIAAPEAAASDDFSQTNTQETKVDEADRIEFNGESLFLLTHPDNQQSQTIKRFNKHADPEHKLVAQDSVLLPEAVQYSGLYLTQNTLTAIGQQGYHYYNFAQSSESHHELLTHVNIFTSEQDLTSSGELTETSLQFQGELISSRRIGNALFLVTRFIPQTEFSIQYQDSKAEQLIDAVTQLEALEPQALMAQYRLNNGQYQSLNESCYIDNPNYQKQQVNPDNEGISQGFRSLVYLIKVDLTNPTNMSSECVGANTEQIYASSQSLFLFGSRWLGDEHSDSRYHTDLHQFSLDDLTYHASGEVPGSVWGNNASYRLSEQDDYLRIITTDYDERWDIKHRLYVLDTSTADMQLIAQLPEQNSNDTLGKPGEDIYAVRYQSDKAYVVTFRRTDPLYILDLSDNESPSITGQLEIPGYSAYLHPVDDNLLIGVGRQTGAVMWGLPEVVEPSNADEGEEAFTPIEFPLPLINDDTETVGAKISLFDISDPTTPQELVTYTYPNTYTPVEWEPHAFTSLRRNSAQLDIALPVYYAQQVQLADGYQYRQQSSLEVISVDSNSKTFDRIGAIQPQYDQNQDDWQQGYRSIIDGEQVYYIDGDHVWQSNIANLSQAVEIQ